MIEQYTMAEKLRELIRDTEYPTDSIPAYKILELAEKYENEAEEIEMQMIVDMQRADIEASAQSIPKRHKYLYTFDMEVFVRYIILDNKEGVFLGTHIDHTRDIDMHDDSVYVLWSKDNVFGVTKAYTFTHQEDAKMFADTTLRRYRTKVSPIDTTAKYVDIVDLIKQGYGNYTYDMVDNLPCGDTIH